MNAFSGAKTNQIVLGEGSTVIVSKHAGHIKNTNTADGCQLRGAISSKNMNRREHAANQHATFA
jgi:hypothetical protein